MKYTLSRNILLLPCFFLVARISFILVCTFFGSAQSPAELDQIGLKFEISEPLKIQDNTLIRIVSSINSKSFSSQQHHFNCSIIEPFQQQQASCTGIQFDDGHLIITISSLSTTQDEISSFLIVAPLMNHDHIQSQNFIVETLSIDGLILNQIETVVDIHLYSNEDEIHKLDRIQPQRVLSDTGSTLSTFTLALSSSTVQEVSSLIVGVKTQQALSSSAQIQLSIPITFLINNSPSCSITPMTTAVLTKNINCEIQNNNNINGSIVTIKSLFYSFGYEPQIDGVIQFKLNDIMINPQSARSDTGSFQLTTYDIVNGGQLSSIDQGLATNPFLIQPGNILNLITSITPSINDFFQASMNMSFTIPHSIPQNGKLILTIPQDFSILDKALIEQSCKSIYGFQASQLHCTLNDNKLTINNGFTGYATSINLSVSFSISGLQTPRYQGNFDNLLRIQTFDNNSTMIDQVYSQLSIASSKSMSSCSVQNMNLINLQPTSLILTLQSSIQLANGDYIRITIPQQVGIISNNISCQQSNSSLSCLNMNNNNGNTIIAALSAGDNSTILSTNSQFNLTGLLNPSSTRPISGMKVSILDSKNRIINECSNDLTLQTKFGSPLQDVSLSQSNTDPGIKANYTIQTSSASNATQYLKVTFPSCVMIDSNLTIITSSGMNLTYTQMGSDSIKLKANSTSSFTIFNLTNPTEQCQYNAVNKSFQISTYEDEFLKFLIDQTVSGIEPSISCQVPCSSCESSNKAYCLSCQTNFLAFLGQCVNKCPSGYYQSLSKCVKCHDLCASCDYLNICTSCIDGYLFDNGECVRTCGEGKAQMGQTCQACSEQCQTCSSVDICSSCKNSNQKMLIVETGQCLDSCPEGTTLKDNQCTKNGIKAIIVKASNLVLEYISYFPLFFLLIILFSIALGSYLRYKSCSVISILLTFSCITETMSTVAFTLISYFAMNHEKEAAYLFALNGASLFVNLFQNSCFMRYFYKRLDKDPLHKANHDTDQSPQYHIDYQQWKSQYPKTRVSLYVLATTISFHTISFYDSKFFGLQSLHMNMFRKCVPLKRIYIKFSVLAFIFPKAGQLIVNFISFKSITNVELQCTAIENTILNFLVIILLLISAKNDRKQSLSMKNSKNQEKQSIMIQDQSMVKDTSMLKYQESDSLQDKGDFINKKAVTNAQSKKKLSKIQFEDLEDILNPENPKKKKSSKLSVIQAHFNKAYEQINNCTQMDIDKSVELNNEEEDIDRCTTIHKIVQDISQEDEENKARNMTEQIGSNRENISECTVEEDCSNTERSRNDIELGLSTKAKEFINGLSDKTDINNMMQKSFGILQVEDDIKVKYWSSSQKV